MLNHLDAMPPEPHPRDRWQSDEQWDRMERRQRFLGVGLALLTLVLAGIAWLAFPVVHQHGPEAARLANVQQSVDNVSDQMRQADEKIQAVSNDRQSFRDEIARVSDTMQSQIRTKLDAAAKQTQAASTEFARRVEAQINDKMRTIDARLGRIESSNDAQQTRVAELQHELSGVKGEMTRQSEQLASIRRDMQDTGTAHDRQFATLKTSMDAGRRDVDAIESKLAVHRIDFEVSKNHNTELAEGISLHITGTDIEHRKVTGWMWIMPDRRTIWLKGQGAQEPVVYYGYQDGKKREMVITNVTRDGATGYVILPGDAASTREVASGSEE